MWVLEKGGTVQFQGLILLNGKVVTVGRNAGSSYAQDVRMLIARVSLVVFPLICRFRFVVFDVVEMLIFFA